MNAELQKFQHEVNIAIDKLIVEQNLACEQLTKEQLASVMRQALACGDLQRHVVHPPKIGEITQSVVYLPYQNQCELEHKISYLKGLLDQHDIEYDS